MMTIILNALSTLYSHVLPFVLLLGILVFVHEFGHFIVARMCGVRVEVFSLGFGKKIFSYKYGDTLYTISILPLGGYVKMFGEQGNESILTDEDKKVAYSHKNPWQRIAVVLAGPLMNFFFAAAVFTVIAQVGEQTRAASIASVTAGSTAEKAGLQAGDKIIQVNSSPIKSYEEFQKSLNSNKGSDLHVTVQTISGEEKKLALPVTTVDNPNIFSLESKLGQVEGIEALAVNATVAVLPGSDAYKVGLRTGDEITSINSDKITRWAQVETLLSKADKNLKIEIDRPSAEQDENGNPKVKTKLSFDIALADLQKFKTLKEYGFDNNELYLGNVVKDSPAQMAELMPYDKLISINQVPINKWTDILETVRSFDGKEALSIVVNRDGTELLKKITPKVTEITNAYGVMDKRYTIGISPLVVYADPELITIKAGSPVEALLKGFNRSIDISVMTVMSFVKMFQGQVSAKNMGGMISIGKAAKDSFEMGAQFFFSTMGVLSISLFIINLLPVPVLDGGHLVFYTIELIKGSPVSLRKMEIAQQVGFVLLLALMIFAQFNDIVKFLFKS
ncbi:MAG: RIP metalloprotease RseP [Pseudobdellovibrio sp.]